MSRLTHIHRFAYLSLCLALAACVVKDKADPTSSATACSSGACDTSTTACETDGCGASTTSDPSSTTDACATDGCDTTYDTTFDMSDTAVDSEASTTEEAPSACAPGAGDLELEWGQLDPRALRGEAVAVGAGRVAWLSGDFNGAQLRVHALADGGSVWEASLSIELGEGDLTFKDVAIDDAGGVVVAGTTGEGGLVRWYDADGVVQHDDVIASGRLAGVTGLDAADIVVAGELDDDMMVRRYGAGGAIAWTRSFGAMGARWSSDVARTPDGGVVLSGHSNQLPAPVVVAYDEAGALQWSYVGASGQSDLAMGVAVDSAGRASVTIYGDLGGRIDRFDSAGAPLPAIALDFQPRAVAVDRDDNVIVVGRDLQKKLVIVERRRPSGALLARYERAGTWGFGIAVDDECHTYIVGQASNGAWLERLR